MTEFNEVTENNNTSTPINMVQTIKDILQTHGDKEYTTKEVENYITEAILLIDSPLTTDTTFEEYHRCYSGETYVTAHYPLKSIETITFNDEEITPDRVDEDGIIYFDKCRRGKFLVRYIVGITEEDTKKYLIPLVVALIENKEGKNISSITEGDVSVSYNNATGVSALTVDSLLASLKEKYCSRVVLL